MRIGLNQLPDDTYVQLKNMDNFIKKFFKCTSNVKAISKKIGIPRTLMSKIRSHKKDKIRLEYLKRISRYLQNCGLNEFSIKNLEKQISALSCCHGGSIKISNNKFPFSFKTEEASKALTFPLSDGYISKDYSGHIRLGYVNANQDLHREIIRCMTKTFGETGYTTRRVAGAYDTYFAGIVGKIYVECLKYAYGDKVKNNSRFPKMLLKLKDPKQIGAVISQIIDDEGYFDGRTLYIGISSGKIKKSKIKYVMNNFKKKKIQEKFMPNLLKDLNILLRKIDVTANIIKPKVYFDKTIKRWKLMWYLLIGDPSNIFKIYRLCKIKRKSLRDKMLKYIKEWKVLLSNLKKVQNKEGCVKSKDISDILNISIFSARNILRTLLRCKIIKEINGKYKLLKFPITR